MTNYKLSQIFLLVITTLIMAHFTPESSPSLNLHKLVSNQAYAQSLNLKPSKTKAPLTLSDSPSEQDIMNWLDNHTGVQTLTWLSSSGLKAYLKLNIHSQSSVIEISEERFGLSFDGKPQNDYSYTQRTFEKTPPYRLKKLSYYQQKAGQTDLKLWVNHRVYTNRSTIKLSYERDPARLQAQAKQLLANLEDQVSTNPKSKSFSQLKLKTRESLLTHLGLSYPKAPLSKEVYLLDLSTSPVQDRRHMLTQVDQRLMRLKQAKSQMSSHSTEQKAWSNIYEHKIIDDTGHSSRALLKDNNQLISTSISYQHHLVDLEQVSQAPPTLSRLLYAKQRMPSSEIKKLLRPYKKELMRCTKSSPKTNFKTSPLVLRLSFVTSDPLPNPSARNRPSVQLIAIAFKDRVNWSAFEDCIAKTIKSNAVQIERDIQAKSDLLIEIALKQL